MNTTTEESQVDIPLTDANDPEDEYRLHRRFDRIGRLAGDEGMKKLLRAKVMVVGLGGVGSFAAEALVRSGVGHVKIVDFDKVCITNTNRQLQALKGQVGRYKANVLAERLRQINPQATVEPIERFYMAENSDEILSDDLDYVIDAIDNVTAKCHLLATCVERGIPVVCSTGASGRWDPTQLRTADLSETHTDPLASSVRKLLRQNHNFPSKGKFGIPAVFSAERIELPRELSYDNGNGFRCVCPGGKNKYHNCDNRNVIYGTAGFVTGTFGLTCASLVVRQIVNGELSL